LLLSSSSSSLLHVLLLVVPVLFWLPFPYVTFFCPYPTSLFSS
jgi:hypothetical protein